MARWGRPTLIVACALVAASALPAHAATRDDIPKPMRKALNSIQDAVDLPTGKGLKAVQVGNRLIFVSANGRFVLEGRAYDAWTGNTISSMADAKRLSNYIDLEAMDVPINDLAPIRLGDGDKRVQVFINAVCDACKKLVKQVRQSDLTNRYTFEFLLIPSKQKGGQLARRIACADDATGRKAFLTFDHSTLPKKPSACKPKALARRVATTYLVEVKKVPTVIAPSGKAHSGLPNKLGQWLKANEKAKGDTDNGGNASSQ